MIFVFPPWQPVTKLPALNSKIRICIEHVGCDYTERYSREIDFLGDYSFCLLGDQRVVAWQELATLPIGEVLT